VATSASAWAAAMSVSRIGPSSTCEHVEGAKDMASQFHRQRVCTTEPGSGCTAGDHWKLPRADH
jgi:hypothetical protein